jgi:hypothetical protein
LAAEVLLPVRLLAAAVPNTVLKLRPVSASTDLGVGMVFAAFELFLTILGSWIKDGSLMRILMAEDDQALAKFVRQGLEGEHYSVDVFPDGEQARTAASELDYDIVILDLNLPKLDGVSVLRHPG